MMVINMGVAYHNLRRQGVQRSSSSTLFPCVGMKASGDRVTIKKCKWISKRGLGRSALLQHIINAKAVISRWRFSYFNSDIGKLPADLVQEMYQSYLRWRGHDKVLIRCRAGVEVEIDTSRDGIVAAAGSIGDVFMLREGTKFRSIYGDGTVVGSRPGELWFTLEGNDTGAWFWSPAELSEQISCGALNFDDAAGA
jgi:hypothetical protein